MQHPADKKFDVVVIGTGPGGEGAAMEATKQGKRVCAVERMPRIGGACTHLGTIPSKSLRAAIYRLMDVNSSPVFRQLNINLEISFRDLRRSAQTVIDQQVSMRRSFYDRNDVEVLAGQARFLDPHRIQVEHEDGSTTIASAEHFIIATGSRPYRPPDVDFSHPRVFDSDTILNLPETPKSMTIYGAGVIGCEYASMFRNLQVKLNLVNTRARMLEFLDDEICDALAYHMRDTGVRIRHNETFDRLEAFDDHVVVHLKSGKQLNSDVLLWANGRTGNSKTPAFSPTIADNWTSTKTFRRLSHTSMPSETSSESPRWPVPPTFRDATPPDIWAMPVLTNFASPTSPQASTPAPKSAASAAPNVNSPKPACPTKSDTPASKHLPEPRSWGDPSAC